jgi:hypothetical protein
MVFLLPGLFGTFSVLFGLFMWITAGQFHDGAVIAGSFLGIGLVIWGCMIGFFQHYIGLPLVLFGIWLGFKVASLA